MKKITAAIMAASAFTATAAQAEAGDVLVRLRGIVVAPNEGNGTGALVGAKVNNDVVPEVDFTYMATKNIGFELIAATSLHKVGLGGATVGRSYVLPPTLTVQYHLMPDAKVRPYVGAGVNYTIFYSEKARGPLAGNDLSMKDSFGWAVQTGVDIDLNKKFFMNIDVKYIDMRAKTKLNGAYIGKTDINPLVFGVGFGTRF